MLNKKSKNKSPKIKFFCFDEEGYNGLKCYLRKLGVYLYKAKTFKGDNVFTIGCYLSDKPLTEKQLKEFEIFRFHINDNEG